MDKRSGSAAGSGKRWKYSQILGFLDPFVTPRETSGNMEGSRPGSERTTTSRTRDSLEKRVGDRDWCVSNESTLQEENDQRGEEDILRSLASSPVSPVPGPSAPAAELTGQQRRRARQRPRERSQDGPSEVEQTLLELLTQPLARPPTPPPRSADEYFLLSLLPFLQSMPPHLKEKVKFQIYKLAMENSTIVLNLEQLDPPTQ
ncbi:uncharacterized protein LOC127642874 [Xyrauchen texanus]|uniref:uncharacterized protein LOC127642874 n=1 Tax=Xyrauchen texanus TaxID=154827 RepID=UPI002242778B|nr:uncharacterized protein LOC127642874 [Xyrauchen texanus]